MLVANALAKRSKLRIAKMAMDKRLPHCQIYIVHGNYGQVIWRICCHVT